MENKTMNAEIEQSLNLIWDCLDHYREDCLGYESDDPKYIEIGKAMNLIEQTLAGLYHGK